MGVGVGGTGVAVAGGGEVGVAGAGVGVRVGTVWRWGFCPGVAHAAGTSQATRIDAATRRTSSHRP